MVDRPAEPAEMSYVEKLVFRFMEEVEQVADHELWAESDGWVGRMILTDSQRGDRVYVYEIKDGKMTPSNSAGPFVGTMTMSEETFLDLIAAATSGTGEVVFQRKYAGRHLHYQGDQWLVDSERFRKVFRRLAAAHRRKV